MFNLLNAAHSLIPSVIVYWRQTIGRTQNPRGQWITEYAPAVPLRCSFQPIEKAKYEYMGLDLNKHYFVLYGSADLLAVERDISGDTVEYQGRRYQFEDAVDWYAYNGWRGIVCVDIGPVPVTP